MKTQVDWDDTVSRKTTKLFPEANLNVCYQHGTLLSTAPVGLAELGKDGTLSPVRTGDKVDDPWFICLVKVNFWRNSTHVLAFGGDRCYEVGTELKDGVSGPIIMKRGYAMQVVEADLRLLREAWADFLEGGR